MYTSDKASNAAAMPANIGDGFGRTRAFAERARRELIATGEKVPKRSAGAHGRLTRQEEQIARLARDGGTSPEIGVQLFLSAARSNGTWARCSPSWASAPAVSCRPRWQARDGMAGTRYPHG
jgi:hypothetical protein